MQYLAREEFHFTSQCSAGERPNTGRREVDKTQRRLVSKSPPSAVKTSDLLEQLKRRILTGITLCLLCSLLLK